LNDLRRIAHIDHAIGGGQVSNGSENQDDLEQKKSR
jgi:hypothetical protein